MNSSTKTIGLVRNQGTYTLGNTQEPTMNELKLGMPLKLFEEVAELALDPNDVNEYADVVDALLGMAQLYGISGDAIRRARAKKNSSRGDFKPPLLWINYDL